MEVEAVSLPIPDLEEVIIQSFLDDSNLIGWVFQLEMSDFIFLI